MLNFTPDAEQYKLILEEYQKIKDHIEPFTDKIDDVTFYIGKLSASGQLIDVLSSYDILEQLPEEFHETLAILRIHAVGQIASLIGEKGYEAVIKTFESPLMAKRDFIC